MNRTLTLIPLAALLMAAAPAPKPQPSPTPDPYAAIEQATARLVLDQEAAQKVLRSDREALAKAEASLKAIEPSPKPKK